MTPCNGMFCLEEGNNSILKAAAVALSLNWISKSDCHTCHFWKLFYSLLSLSNIFRRNWADSSMQHLSEGQAELPTEQPVLLGTTQAKVIMLEESALHTFLSLVLWETWKKPFACKAAAFTIIKQLCKSVYSKEISMKSALAVLGMVGTGGATKPREIKEDKHIPPQRPEKKFKFPGKHS